MPLYEYKCDGCGCVFELIRGMSQADETAVCPNCDKSNGRRQISRFAAWSKGGDGSSRAVAGSGSCSSCSASTCSGCQH